MTLRKRKPYEFQLTVNKTWKDPSPPADYITVSVDGIVVTAAVGDTMMPVFRDLQKRGEDSYVFMLSYSPKREISWIRWYANSVVSKDLNHKTFTIIPERFIVNGVPAQVLMNNWNKPILVWSEEQKSFILIEDKQSKQFETSSGKDVDDTLSFKGFQL